MSDLWAGVLDGLKRLSSGKPDAAYDDAFYIDTLRAIVCQGKTVRLQPDDAARILRIIEAKGSL